MKLKWDYQQNKNFQTKRKKIEIGAYVQKLHVDMIKKTYIQINCITVLFQIVLKKETFCNFKDKKCKIMLNVSLFTTFMHRNIHSYVWMKKMSNIVLCNVSFTKAQFKFFILLCNLNAAASNLRALRKRSGIT